MSAEEVVMAFSVNLAGDTEKRQRFGAIEVGECGWIEIHNMRYIGEY